MHLAFRILVEMISQCRQVTIYPCLAIHYSRQSNAGLAADACKVPEALGPCKVSPGSCRAIHLCRGPIFYQMKPTLRPIENSPFPPLPTPCCTLGPGRSLLQRFNNHSMYEVGQQQSPARVHSLENCLLFFKYYRARSLT